MGIWVLAIRRSFTIGALWSSFRKHNWDGIRRLDLLVEDLVLLELKATTELKNSDHNQIINLLKVFDIEVGLLINFGKPSLEFKRFAN